MDAAKEVSVIIPSLNPTDDLMHVVTSLIEVGFDDIIVIDDGSDEMHKGLFGQIKEFPECTVLTHEANMGKGAALKTAFSYVQRERCGKKGAVTADGDRQHKVDDIIRCVGAMLESDGAVILGARDFGQSHVPSRNSFGNRLTSFAFRNLLGIKLRDTQTGLRAIPAAYIPLMQSIRGNRFEYETNMLLELKRRDISMHEVEIETVYIEGSNERSHYRPFWDSVRIFGQIFVYVQNSAISFIVDIILFWLAIRYIGVFYGIWAIPACTLIARAISSFLNFNLNRKLVFARSGAYGSHISRYYSLVAVQMSVSAGVLWLLAHITGFAQGVWLLTLLKIVVDIVLFFLSYHIQRTWVFKK